MQVCSHCEGEVRRDQHVSLEQIAILVNNTSYVHQPKHSKTVSRFLEAAKIVCQCFSLLWPPPWLLFHQTSLLCQVALLPGDRIPRVTPQCQFLVQINICVQQFLLPTCQIYLLDTGIIHTTKHISNSPKTDFNRTKTSNLT